MQGGRPAHVWYNRAMARRLFLAALLLLFALTAPAVYLDACTDEASSAVFGGVVAILGEVADAAPPRAVQHVVIRSSRAVPLAYAADILHVPLLG